MTKDNPTVIVLGAHGCGAGQIRVHKLPVPGESIEGWDFKILKDGGKASHKAMILSKYGVNTAFIGKLGTDDRSKVGISWLVEHHVNIDHLILSDNYRDEGAISFMLLDDDGNNMIICVDSVREKLKFDEVKDAIEDFNGAKIFITDFEIPFNTAINGLKLAKQLGMYTILNPSPVPIEAMGSLDYVDMICPNETEAKQMLGLDTSKSYAPLDLSRQLSEKFQVGNIIITLGGDGAFYWDKEQTICEVKPVKIIPRDPSGAGDNFISSFVYCRMILGKSIGESMNWANHAAALSVSRPGSIDSFPTKEEVDEFVIANP